MVSLCTCVAHFGKSAAHLDVPDSAALLGAVDAFLEFENMALGDFETGRSLHVDFFLKIGVEICGFDVHLVNFKIVFGGEGENGVE